MQIRSSEQFQADAAFNPSGKQLFHVFPDKVCFEVHTVAGML